MNETLYFNPAAERYRHIPPAITVLIPTYNRHDHLTDMLNLWQRQEHVCWQEFEVVLADDGSSDDSSTCIREWAQTTPMRVVLSPSHTNHGPAHARNRAIAIATGDVLLITGDDILPPADFLVRHLDWHRSHIEVHRALLGRVVWPEEPEPTPFMRWLDTKGRSFFFFYPDAAGPVRADLFYTCNVSIKRALIGQAGNFDEHFPYASHEDLELGMRLARLGGMQLHYEPTLVASHDHRLTLKSSIQRVYRMGLSSIIYWERVPNASPAWKERLRNVLISIAALRFAQKAYAILIKTVPQTEKAPLDMEVFAD